MRTLTTLFASVLLLAMPLLLARPAAAEGEEKKDISAEIKAQMDEILALMKSNQEALLELSTGRNAKPKQVDVRVPPVGEQKDPATDGAGATKGSAEGNSTDGESAARKIDALLGTQKKGSKQIPSEIEKLLKMIPT